MPVKRKPKRKQPIKQKQKQSQRQSVVVNVITGKSKSKSSKPRQSQSQSVPIIQTLPLAYSPPVMYQQNYPYDDINRRALVPMTNIPSAIPITAEPAVLNVMGIAQAPRNAEPIGIQLATDNKYDDTYTPTEIQEYYDKQNKLDEKLAKEDKYFDELLKIKAKALEAYQYTKFLEDPRKQVPYKNDIMDSVYTPSKGAYGGDIADMTTEELKKQGPSQKVYNSVDCDVCSGRYDPTDAHSTNRHFNTKKHKEALNKQNVKK